MLETTLCYIERGGKYLMLHRNKKKNDLNEGKWLGVGGKIEPGETPRDCVIREAFEETGLTLLEPEYRGKINFFEKTDGGEFAEIMHLFTCTRFAGEIKTCDEGTLEWVNIADVPRLPLWEGDRVFLRLMRTQSRPFEVALKYLSGRLVYESTTTAG